LHFDPPPSKDEREVEGQVSNGISKEERWRHERFQSIRLRKAVNMVTQDGLAEIVGVDNVTADPAVLKTYAADHSFVGKVTPQFVVKVDGLETVKKVVRLAKETGTGLVPVSSGGPHFHGDTVPSASDAVVVDLSSMKKVDLIDTFERVASMIEPGVTFGELIPAVAKEGLRLNMPLQPRKNKSVVGSMLSREPVIMPHYHWDISDPIGSTEVVFGTGDMFRTGAAAGPGSIAEQRKGGGVQKEAAGPSATSLHRMLQGAQGTMGIVTWASARCELIPDREQPYFITSSDVAKLLDAARWLIRLRLGNELLILNGANVAGLLAQDDLQHATLMAKLPEWVLFCNLGAYKYFPDMRMQGQIQDTKELLQRLGLQTVQNVGGIGAGEFLEAIRRPSAEPYWKLRRSGRVQDVFFLTMSAKVPGQIKMMAEAAEAAGYPASEMGIYVQPIVQGSNWHVEFNLFYDPSDPAQTKKVRGLATSTIEPLMNAGAFFSRPFGEAARQIMSKDPASVEALKKFKAIIDPAGILNPGKLCF
jgi:FAD/FMN-containing dehydrogenase